MLPTSHIHRFFCCFLLLVALTVSSVPAAARAGQALERSAAYTCNGPDDHCTFLPVVSKIPPYPYLITPNNQAQLDTLIPTFSWDLGPQPENTTACLAIGTTTEPTNCVMAYSISAVTYRKFGLHYNLIPNTRYYWRIGVASNDDYQNKQWTEQFTFTSGPAGGIVPSVPVLVSPGNNSTVGTKDLTLTWQAVDGAVEYDVTLHSISTNRWFAFSGVTSPQRVVADFAGFVSSRGLGTEFEWFVQARNDYAWSNESNPWKFTYTYTGSLRSPALYEADVIVIDGWEFHRIEP